MSTVTLENSVVMPANLDQIVHLRHAELRKGLPLEAAYFEGDNDPMTQHFGLFASEDQSEALVCATFMRISIGEGLEESCCASLKQQSSRKYASIFFGATLE
jgi:hypothetical protein